MTDSAKWMARVVVTAVVAVVATVFLVSVALASRDTKIYPSNVYVGDICLSGLTEEQAREKLSREIPAKWGEGITLVVGQSSVTIPWREIDASYDIPATLERVEEGLSPRHGLVALFYHSIIRGQSQRFNPVVSWDERALESQLQQIKAKYDRPATDARITCQADFLQYVPHSNGYSLNIPESRTGIIQSLQNGRLNPIQLNGQEIVPRIKLQDIKDIKDLLSAAMKNIPDGGREALVLPVNRINGVIVLPGEGFTVSELCRGVAPSRERVVKAEKGNGEIPGERFVAPVLEQACQQVKLDKTGQPIRYWNNGEHPLLIASELEGNHLAVRIYGVQTEAGKEIKIITEAETISPSVRVEEDRKLAPGTRIMGQEGKSGQVVRSFEVITRQGKIVEKNLLSEDYHPPTDTVIQVGPKQTDK
jgi:hypothetical protein